MNSNNNEQTMDNPDISLSVDDHPVAERPAAYKMFLAQISAEVCLGSHGHFSPGASESHTCTAHYISGLDLHWVRAKRYQGC